MTAKEFFESQSVTDANSVIKKYAKYYNRFDMMRFAEAYHRNEVEKSKPITVNQETDICKCNGSTTSKISNLCSVCKKYKY